MESSSEKGRILCMTVLVETSPQALPLGAACIASSLKNNPFIKEKFTVELADFSLEEKDFSSLIDDDSRASRIASSLLQKGKLNFFCASVYVWNRKIISLVIQKVKALSPNTVCIAGGPEITANPFSFTDADFSVAGEGECAVPELISLLCTSEKIADENNLPQGVYVPDGREASSFLRANAPDLEKTESPWLDGSLSVKKYGGALWELARGCPFKCSYCYESRGEKKVRHFSRERLERELDFFAKEKVPQVFVLDPTYNADKNKALEMLRLIRKKTPHTFYYFEARAEFITRELADAFSKINCSLQFGLQSANPEVLKTVHRSLDKKLFSKNISLLNQTGVIFGFDLIFGLPKDTLKGFKESIDYALSLYPNNLELFCLSVLPGTDLAERAEELGLTWQKLPPYQVICTTSMTEKDMLSAMELSQATNIFYTQGRAVPWFNSLLHLIKRKASDFLTDFALFLKNKNINLSSQNCLPFDEIKKLQLEFIKDELKRKNLMRLEKLVTDIIVLNAALSEATASGKESVVQLSYHPDDLMSEYASDLLFFYENARKIPNRTKVFCTGQGVDWKTL